MFANGFLIEVFTFLVTIASFYFKFSLIRTK